MNLTTEGRRKHIVGNIYKVEIDTDTSLGTAYLFNDVPHSVDQ